MKNILLRCNLIATSSLFIFNNFISAQILNPKLAPISQDQFSIEIKDKASNDKLGELSVLTDPPGADIYLDGNRIESSPITKELESGKHHLRITSPGWKEEECSFEIQVGKKTVVTALMQKPEPMEMMPEDIGRVYKEELSFGDFEKEEVEYTYVKPSWPSTAKKFSVLLMGVGAITAMTTFKDGSFTNAKNTTTKVVIASMGLGMIGTVVFYVIDEHSGHWQDKRIEENIDYNKKKKAAIENHNKDAREYNLKTKQMLTQEMTKRRNEIDQFNQNRGLTIEII